jgi:O-antigen/teichoic acid export membrane protein
VYVARRGYPVTDVRPRSFGRNSLSVIAANLAATAGATFVTIVTARWLGPSGRGLYAIAVLIPALIFALGSVGMPAATTFLTARGRYADDVVVRASIFVSAGLGLAAALAGGVVLLTVARGILGPLPTRDALIALSSVPFLFVFMSLQAFLLGKQRFSAYNSSIVAQSILLLMLLVGGLSALARSVDVAVAASSIATAVAAVGIAIWCGRGMPSTQLPRTYSREAFRYGIRAHTGNVLTFLGYRLDVFLLAAYTSASTVGIYSAAVAIGERPWIFSYAVSSVLFSRLAGEPDDERRRALTPLVTRTSLWITAVGAGVLAAFSRPIVRLLYSGAFDGAVAPLRAILVGIVFFSVGRILANDIAARGQPLINSYTAAAATVANIAANVVLIPGYGATGAAIASTLSYGLQFVLTTLYYCRASGNSARSLILPTPTDVAVWRRSLAFGRGGRI